MQSERRLGRGCILDFYHPDAKVCIEVMAPITVAIAAGIAGAIETCD